MMMQEGNQTCKTVQEWFIYEERESWSGPVICITYIVYFDKETMQELRNAGVTSIWTLIPCDRIILLYGQTTNKEFRDGAIAF